MEKNRSISKDRDSEKEDSCEESVFDIPDDITPKTSMSRAKSLCRSSKRILPVTIARQLCKHKQLPDRANQTQICVVRETDLQKHKSYQESQGHRPLVIVKDKSPSSMRKDINIVLHKNRNVTISNRDNGASKDAAVNTNNLPKITLPNNESEECCSTSRVVSQLADLIKAQQLQQGQASISCFPEQLSEQLQALSSLALQTQADLQALAQQTQSQLSELAQVTAKTNAEIVAKNRLELDTASAPRREQETAPVTKKEQEYGRLSRAQSPSGLGERTMSSVLKLLVPIMDIIDTIANDDRRRAQETPAVGPVLKSRVSFQPVDGYPNDTNNNINNMNNINGDSINAFRHRDSSDCIQGNFVNDQKAPYVLSRDGSDMRKDSEQTITHCSKDSRTRIRSLERNHRNMYSGEQLKAKDSVCGHNTNFGEAGGAVEKQQACIDIITSAVEKMKQTLGPSNDEIVHSALQHVFGRDGDVGRSKKEENYETDLDTDESVTDDIAENGGKPMMGQFRPTVKYDNILHHNLIQNDLRRTLRMLNEHKHSPTASAVNKMVRSLDQCLRDLSASGTREVEETCSVEDRIPASTVNSAIDGELRPKLGHTEIPGIPSGSADIQRDMLRAPADRKYRKRDGSLGE